MKFIICVDDNNGMMFNKRRQSRDRAVVDDIAKTVGENVLYADGYSKELFKDCAGLKVSESIEECEKNNGYFFAENVSICKYADRITEITVYHWNRVYPSNFKADFDYRGMCMTEKTEFAGFSHPVITKEVYKNV